MHYRKWIPHIKKYFCKIFIRKYLKNKVFAFTYLLFEYSLKFLLLSLGFYLKFNILDGKLQSITLLLKVLKEKVIFTKKVGNP